jgi:polyphosphate glucokinase
VGEGDKTVTVNNQASCSDSPYGGETVSFSNTPLTDLAEWASIGRRAMEILGIDVGGSGIKGAPVDIERGALAVPYHRITTPHPATPDAVADVVAELVAHFGWRGPVGCTFPAIIKGGVAYSAANVDKGWVGTDGAALFGQRSGCPFLLINDGDAAGIAEMQFGAGRGQNGVVMMLTIGTGIGSALFVDGRLVPNTELGHVEIRGKEAEQRASDRTREKKKLNWKQWTARVDEVLKRFDALFSPSLFIIGGGVSKKHEKFLPLLTVRTPVVPAALLNEAGMIGAALAARALPTTTDTIRLPAAPAGTLGE